MRPRDFPLLDRVGGHDDRPVLCILALRDRLFAEAQSAAAHERGWEFEFAPRANLAAELEELVAGLRRFLPWLDAAVSAPCGGSARLSLAGSSGLRDTIARDIERIRQRAAGSADSA